MSHPNTDTDNGGLLALALVALTVVCATLIGGHDKLTIWKAALAHRDQIKLIHDIADLHTDQPLIMYTGKLHTFAPLIDARNNRWNQFAALKIEQRHKVGGRRYSTWITAHKDISLTPSAIDDADLTPEIIENNSALIWAGISIPSLNDNERLKIFGTPYFQNSTAYYGETEIHRLRYNDHFIYSAIFAPQIVTFVGAVQQINGHPRFIPTTLLPAGYPALWPGFIKPDEFLNIHFEFIYSILMAIGGVLTASGWICLAIIDSKHEHKRKLGLGWCIVVSLGASASSMLIWFFSENWSTTLFCWLGLTAGLYGLCRKTLLDGAKQ